MKALRLKGNSIRGQLRVHEEVELRHTTMEGTTNKRDDLRLWNKEKGVPTKFRNPGLALGRMEKRNVGRTVEHKTQTGVAVETSRPLHHRAEGLDQTLTGNDQEM